MNSAMESFRISGVSVSCPSIFLENLSGGHLPRADALEPRLVVHSVTEGLFVRMAATAERYLRAGLHDFAVTVQDVHGAFD